MCYFQLLGNNLFQKKNYQNKQQRGFITTWFSLRFDPLIHRYQNDQRHFKSLSVFAAWFPRFAWPFWTLCIKVLIVTLREKCPYSEFFWSVFSHICTEYGEILRVSLFSQNAGKYRPEELLIRTLFMQWHRKHQLLLRSIFATWSKVQNGNTCANSQRLSAVNPFRKRSHLSCLTQF